VFISYIDNENLEQVFHVNNVLYLLLSISKCLAATPIGHNR